MEVNAYSSSYPVNSKDVDNIKVQKKNESLDMQDFLNLLVAEMTNQDAMNPMDNTEFISQMAQFSSLQAMTDLSKIAVQGQATSLIGKNVVVADYNSKGELEVQEGLVQRVTIHSGETKLYVNDMEFDYSNVMEIKAVEQKQEDPMLEMMGEVLKGVNNLNDSYNNSNIPVTEEIVP